jgi:Xaa-Pro dipeptidase
MAADTIAPDAELRLAKLRESQALAERLFAEIAARELIRPGANEVEISKQIKALARELLGVERYWHKRVIRVGSNTLHPYDDNPGNRTVAADDIAFVDLGPIFEEWESDFGRTFVLGDDPAKLALKADVESAWYAGKQFFDERPECTGAELFEFAQGRALAGGWTFGGTIAGHLLGEFPHEKLDDDEIESYVVPANHHPMRSLDPLGRPRHWILEIHFVDRGKQIGGFFEQLLTIG